MMSLLQKAKKIFVFGILLFHTLVFSQIKNIVFSSKTDSVSLYNNAEIAYTNNVEVTLEKVSQLDFKVFNKNTKNVFPVPDTLQYAVIKFSIHNNQSENSKIYLTAKDTVSYLKCYELADSNYEFVGGTGYAYFISQASIKNNHHQLVINLAKNSITTFVIYIKKYKYTLKIPELQLQSNKAYLTEVVENKSSFNFYLVFTTIIAGFQLALLLFGLFKIYFYGFKKIYLFFSLICFMFILFYLSEINGVVYETKYLPFFTNDMVYDALGDLYIIAFNFLIISFFDLDKKSFLYKFLTRISFFWLLLMFIEILPFVPNKIVIVIFRFILNTSPIVDFITLSCIFYYALNHRNGYRKYIFVGIFILMISSFEIAFPRFLNLIHLSPNWIKISKSSYLLLQICDNINFCFFFIAFIIKDKEISLEKEILEIEHLKKVEEVKQLKKLVEKENIILKDKTKINLDQLVYIKAEDHYLNIFTIGKKSHLVRGKLTDIIKELPSNFINCHRSYIVNKNHIKKIQFKFITMVDNSEVPVSRGFKI
ncbi:LytTR family transcriptional regulator DNA-binding domain-containing protein [Flavobacterium pectinovorum]|uniref:LytTR family transcriptional regulator DNA-binding domain-containing protein n=1 Tax=Flavobacterium pectinovorum TaxID=29533 RepID=UPI001FAB80D6|nr:LytTR family transcriptional regulator DNA-binding domain-containing protein [Flavobacterium pectinovorum]MCI9844756.1 LytTR family transcriptional regulator DNA-binding domain-containing protein [Flavobacterium pectinovorum]